MIGVSGDERATAGEPGRRPRRRTTSRDGSTASRRRCSPSGSTSPSTRPRTFPATSPPGLALLGAPPREDARDVLCGATGLGALARRRAGRHGQHPPRGAAAGAARGPRRRRAAGQRRHAPAPSRPRAATTRSCSRSRACAGSASTPSREPPCRWSGSSPRPARGSSPCEGRAGDEAASTAARAIGDPPRPARSPPSARSPTRSMPPATRRSAHTPGRPAMAGSNCGRSSGCPTARPGSRDAGVGSPDAPEALGRELADRLRAAGAGELLRRAEEMAVEHA